MPNMDGGAGFGRKPGRRERLALSRLAGGTGHVVRRSRRSQADQEALDIARAGVCTAIGFVVTLATGAGLRLALAMVGAMVVFAVIVMAIERRDE